MSKIFQLNAIRCIDQRIAFKISGFSILALIFNLINLRTTILHSKKLQVAKHLKLYTIFFCELTRKVPKGTRAFYIIAPLKILESGPGPGLGHLAHGRDYSDCRASEQKSLGLRLSIFLELSKIT